MIFVFGGAYQGKLDFVKEKFGLSDNDIFNGDGSTCKFSQMGTVPLANLTTGTVPLAKEILDNGVRCINGLDIWVRALVDNGADVDSVVNEFIDSINRKSKDIVIIMNDVSQGIVPMDPVERAFREANGRTMIKLAREAEEVYRVFCGIGIRIK